jgi:hypothetical protein
VSRVLPPERVEEVKREIAGMIERELPNADVVIATLPRALDDEIMAARVRAIAAQEGRAVYDVAAIETAGNSSVISFALEAEGSDTLGAAHAAATDLKARLIRDFGSGTTVEIRIEPVTDALLRSREVDGDRREAIRAALCLAAEAGGVLREPHGLRVRETALGLAVAFRARANAEESLGVVRAGLDRIEADLLCRDLGITRVTGLAEPRRRHVSPELLAAPAHQGGHDTGTASGPAPGRPAARHDADMRPPKGSNA